MEHPLAQFLYCPECGSSHFEVNNEKSKKCADCGFVYYFNPSAATVALILNEKNELLVCRRAKEPAKGTLDLPGGFIDMFFLCTVENMSHFSAMDDVADAFFLPLSEINSEDFGLDSIRRGLKKFLSGR